MLEQRHSELVMGFDFGLRRTGVAIGLTAIGRARPLITLQLRQGTPDWVQLTALIEEWQPHSLVVGNPNSLNNKNLMDRLVWFTKELQRRYALPIHLIDEQYSSLEAGYMLKQNNHHKRISKEKLDKIAAVLILESWFCENNSTK